MEGEEVEQADVRAELTPADQIQPKDSDEVIELLKVGYGERWQGEDNYRTAILNNATELLRIYVEDVLAASLFLDHSRITAIAVHPDMRGRGLGVRLFEEAAKAQPDVWISAGIDAEEMMATLTNAKLNFLPINDQAEIEALYRTTNQGRNAFEVEVETREIPFLTERLERKAIHQDKFTTYTRAGGTHKTVYRQVLFQNQA